MAGNNIHSQLTDQAEIHVPKGFTEAANHSAGIKNEIGQLEWRDLDSLGEKSNFSAIVDPTITDDHSLGYNPGSRWVNTVQRNMFECVDATPGAAVWRVVIRNNPNATVAPTTTDDASKGYKEGSSWVVISDPINQVWMCANSAIGQAQWLEIDTGAVIGFDHRTLSHLDSDDHLQYLNRSGVRPMTGNLDMGTHDLINVTNVFGEKRLLIQNVVRVKKNPGFGEFSSIAAAAASISGSSSSNLYLIEVGPGVYTEPEINVPPFVFISGIEMESVVVQPDANNHHVFNISVMAGVNFLSIKNAGPGFAALYLNDVGKFTIVHKVTIGNCDIGVWCRSVSKDCQNFLEYVDTSGGTTGIKIEALNGFTCFVNAENFYVFAADGTDLNPNDGALITGTGAQFICQAAGFEGTNGLGNAIRVRDGGLIDLKGLSFRNWTTGLFSENFGTAVDINVNGATFLDNGMDFNIVHPGTTGAISSTASEEASFFDPGTIGHLSLLLVDPVDGNVINSGFIKSRQPNNVFTDLTTLSSNAPAMGILANGDINPPIGGTTVTVEAGLGYLQKSDGSLMKIIWPDTPITIPSNVEHTIYFDGNSVLQQSASPPNDTQNIILGRIVTGTGIILAIEESGFASFHAANAIGRALREGIGSVYASGSNVSELGTRTLSVSAGSYYYGERNFITSGGSPITFTSFYRNGTGGFTSVATQTVIDNAFWDNGTGTLTAIGAGNYARHSVYLLGDSTLDPDSEAYYVVYSQAQYTALTLAEQGSLPNPPAFMTGAITLVASVIVQQGHANIIEVLDERPIVGSGRTASVSASTFHSNLLGLTAPADDHTQYVHIDGRRAMTGDLSLGTHNLTNIGTANGVVVENHHARHQPGGADAIPTAAPSTQTPNQANAVGVSSSLARADHVHNVPTAAPVTQNPDSANADGIAATFAKSDHAHNIPTAVATTQTPDNVNGQGVSTSFARADHVHNVPTATAVGLDANAANAAGGAATFARSNHTHAIASGLPTAQTPDQANATGTSANFARADHVHNIPTASASGLNAVSANTQGTSASFARSDHTHSITSAAPSTQNADQANAVGSSTSFARADHIHSLPTAVPADIGSANAQGVATTFVKSDHVHKGLHSVQSNGGTQRFGDINLKSGISISVTDNGDNSYTFDTIGGENELFVTNGGGLVANFTTGKVRYDGTFTQVAAGTITLTANITNGRIYVDVDGTVKQTASNTLPPPYTTILALFTTGVSTITLITDHRTFLDQNIVRGLVGDITTDLPDNAASAGSTNRLADAGHQHAIATAAASGQTPNQVNAKGVSTSFARADHVHNIPTGTPSTLNATNANTQGTAAAFAQQDHLHAITTGAPSTQTPDQANATGTSASLARADHVHTIATAAASSLTTASTNTQGASTSFARADHTHAITVSNQSVNAAAGATSAALTDTLITGMTLTPTAGTYMAYFVTSSVNSANGTQRTFISLYFNGVQVNNSEVAVGGSGGAYIPSTNIGIIAANGTNAIEARARVAGGTTTFYEMQLILIRLGN